MIKKGLTLLMILPLGFVLFNNTVNRHQHQLPNGMIIEHSHPFSSCCSEGKNHEHSDLELLLFTLLCDSTVTDDGCAYTSGFIAGYASDLKSGYVFVPQSFGLLRCCPLRAPPLNS
ncbi:MAG: hypothetical protein EA408_10765 [Marinilabiliales bacterium]|nr:MAG: hypothetical protein EA408_10765 [Marinilabiliales bacterium]